MLISICIPSYNRPEELYRLLQSVNCGKYKDSVEIIICEDCAPLRAEVAKRVREYQLESVDGCRIQYIENETNLGYDRNLRECIKHATGDWIIFMGDDDLFIKDALEGYIEFLDKHGELGYVLRSYKNVAYTDSNEERQEEFRYYKDTCFFEPGERAYEDLFRKSVFISGVTFKREAIQGLETDMFDGTLLYQLYLVAETCMNFPSAYYGEPITMAIEGGVPFFGSSETEQDKYTPGEITIENSLNFMEGFFKISEYIDKRYGIQSTDIIKRDFSKYAYPVLSVQRHRGRRPFRNYHKRLKLIGINKTAHYYIYYWGLLFLGTGFCSGGIRLIKRIMGRTPSL